MNIDLDDTLERMGDAGQAEEIHLLHPDESLEIYNHIVDLNRSKSRQEWGLLLVVLALFWSLWFNWSYYVNLKWADRVINYYENTTGSGI